jgi:hypothetical protein
VREVDFLGTWLGKEPLGRGLERLSEASRGCKLCNPWQRPPTARSQSNVLAVPSLVPNQLSATAYDTRQQARPHAHSQQYKPRALLREQRSFALPLELAPALSCPRLFERKPSESLWSTLSPPLAHQSYI